MTITEINKDYKEAFLCSTQVSWDMDTLEIYINDKFSVAVGNVDKATAITLAEYLLPRWDFSFTLEFDNEEEFYTFLK